MFVLAEATQATPIGVGTAAFAVGHSCSAFAIDAEHVLTAAHCLTDRAEVDLRTPSGDVTRATLVRVDARLDAALLRAARPLPRSARLALDGDTPPIGGDVYLDGSSGLGFAAFVHGTVAASVRGSFGEVLGPMTLTDIQAWHGMSGAPLIDASGHAVGMAVGWLDIDFADSSHRGDLLRVTPAEDLRDFLADRVASPVRRDAAFAAAHRADDGFAFAGARTLPSNQVLLDFWDDRAEAVDVRLRRGGVEIYADQRQLTPGDSSVGLPLTAADVAGAELELRAHATERRARFAASGEEHLLATPADTYMKVKLDPPVARDHGWRSFHVDSVAALDGHLLALRPLVLDGTMVVGDASPHVTMESRQSSPLTLSFDGVFLAQHPGVYDVVLLAGDVPVAHCTLNVL